MNAYRRGAGGPTDVAMAAAAGLLAGSVVFYLARVWFQREPVGVVERRGEPPDGEDAPSEEDVPPDGDSGPAPDRRSDPAPS